MDVPRFVCNICSASFGRSAHLHRHRRSHSGDESYQCTYCLWKFTRRDSLRKHWKSCLFRKAQGHPVPNPKLCGRKRRACDQCALGKRACNFEFPCGTCSQKGYSCSYRRMGTHLGASMKSFEIHCMSDSTTVEAFQCSKEVDEVTMTTTKPTMSLAPFALTALIPSSIPIDYTRFVSQQASRWLYFQAFETERFEFLLNFTTYDGLESSFNFLTSSEKKTSTWQFDHLLTIDDLLDVNYEFSNNRIEGPEKPSYSSRIMECLYDPLLPQTRAICEKLLQLPSIDGTVTKDCAQFFGEKCLEFFNPMNLRRLLNTYWKRWHRNCPIIHPSSFDRSQAPTELVLAMALIGACVSKDSQDAKYAREWLDRAERLIFGLPWLSREDDSNQTHVSLARDTKLRLLQAAILMCVLQTWEGSNKAGRRVRNLRYPNVAQASQELVYSQPGEHIGADLAATLRHWDEFIIEEQLIRTKSYIFLLDTAFTIFHMTPPRISISKLDFPFSYPDSCFHARTGNEFFETVQRLCPSYPATREMRIRQGVHILFDAEDLTANNSLPELTDLGGFILISAIHSIIFCQQMAYFSSPYTTTPLLQSLDRWLSLWNKRIGLSQPGLEIHSSIDRDPSVGFKGFVRHSLEYYTLALAKLDMINGQRSVDQASLIADAGKENVKQLISDVKRVWPSRVDAATAGAV